MVSDVIGTVADEVGGAVDDAVGEDLAKADKLLSGKERSATDIEKMEAEFVRGVDLSTPDGDVPSTAAAPNDPGASKPKFSTLSGGKRIEIIHFGKVHRDWARNFHHDQVLDDMKLVDLAGVIGSRAIGFRAALEREAVLLAGFARATGAALAEKDQKEGATDDLLTAAADLLGGATGTAQAATAADLTPFLEKIEKDAWKPLNKPLISYGNLHTAGIKLHEVRVNLRAYVREQLEAQKDPPVEEKGLLSDLPVIGELPLPGFLGEAIGFMQKVTGKLYDVQTALIFDLLLAMQIPIEKACEKVSLEQLQKKTSPIYPAWFVPPKADDEGDDEPFANYQQDDVVQGDLKSTPLDEINKGVQSAVGEANKGINEAVEKPLEVIDFLSKEVEPAPGNKHLDDVFGAQKEPDGPFFGSEILGKVAVASFARAIGSGEIPGFMVGFVGDFVEKVFGICAEFLRAVYNKLCCLKPDEVISSEELTKAARDHLVFKLVDVALEKSGLDGVLDDATYEIPECPVPLPSGFNFPTGKVLSLDPIIAMLTAKLSDELAPVIDPVMEYAMAGLAGRLNDQRMWASGKAMTMEAHLAQLPAELALMFRNLFGPVWEFFTDTIMGAANDAMAEVLGPMGDAVGLMQDGLGAVTDGIADAKKKAAEAQAYAKNIEDKAGKLMDELSSIEVGTGNTGDIADIMNAADALGDAIDADPFSDDAGGGGDGPGAGGAPFPQDRLKVGKGMKIDAAEREKVEPDLKWEEAKAQPGEEDEAGEDEPGDEEKPGDDGEPSEEAAK